MKLVILVIQLTHNIFDRLQFLPVPRTRRKRLILKYTLATATFVGVAAVTLLVVRNRTRRYVPGEQVSGISNDLARNLPADFPRVQSTDVAAEAGINFEHFAGTRTTQLPEDMGSGAAWGDYDGDGFQDLYIADIAALLDASPEQMAASPGGNRLYHNNGNGTFTDVTQQAGVGFKGLCNGAAWGDYDNDGWPDLLVAAQAPYEESVRCLLDPGYAPAHDTPRLFHNEKNGRFDEVTRALGLARCYGTMQVLAADLDSDGWTDLVLVNGSLDAERLEPSVVLHNEQGKRFREWFYLPDFDAPANLLGGAVADFDGNGAPDLYLARNPHFSGSLRSPTLFVNRLPAKTRSGAGASR